MNGMKETIWGQAVDEMRGETTLAMFCSVYTRPQWHVSGLKVNPSCPNYNVTQAAPAHIFACHSCYKKQLLSNPATVLQCLKTYRRLSWHCFQDGVRFNCCQVIYSQFGLAIHQNDHQARRRFVEWAQNEITVVPDFHKRILFSDEAHFWLNDYVNKQNCSIWSEANS
ncbi:uncharacterized protein TNCV_4687491 [Trichonephila clavipes]|nr:uncharacterized protein TNCV_4687491 [Trichonephila clavipes]